MIRKNDTNFKDKDSVSVSFNSLSKNMEHLTVLVSLYSIKDVAVSQFSEQVFAL